MESFCYQCEQTISGTGCTQTGNCGKDPTTSVLQDLVVHAAKGIAMYAHRAQQLGVHDDAVGRAVIEALFTTVTNVDFDPANLEAVLGKLGTTLQKAKAMYQAACDKKGAQAETLSGPATWAPAKDRVGLIDQAAIASLKAKIAKAGVDAAGLSELVLYGLKGTAAYAEHAAVLGKESSEVYASFYELLDLLTREGVKADELLGASLKVGELNLKVMGLLDEGNTGTYGHPVPTAVRVSAVKGKAILVSGHDLKDLELLLKQTEGKGVNVYTHGEMLPAHGYPELKKYKHLVGNWGGAWQDQVREFDAFPGAFLFTTNCIQKPKESYKGRVFTSGLVSMPG
ncbi:MAG: hydroxylamine reductase, partial [Deltaproteobacteria bacterium]|nr:hydroxylamine reductase [Deltaproteobacteria bacterium]